MSRSTLTTVLLSVLIALALLLSACSPDSALRVSIRTLPNEEPFLEVVTLAVALEVDVEGQVASTVEVPVDQNSIELPAVPAGDRARVLLDGYSGAEPPARLAAGASGWADTSGGGVVAIDVCFCLLATFEAGGCTCGS